LELSPAPPARNSALPMHPPRTPATRRKELPGKFVCLTLASTPDVVSANLCVYFKPEEKRLKPRVRHFWISKGHRFHGHHS
jgi:hypothetical protein